MQITRLDKLNYAGQIDSLEALFRASFGRDLPENYLRWRYLENPFGDLCAHVGFADETLVANYSISPVVLRYRELRYRGALSMTTMTAPNHRRQGWFVHLAKALYRTLAEEKYDVVFGFPNAESENGFFNNLDWELTRPVLSMSYEIKPETPWADLGATDDRFELEYDGPDHGAFVAIEKDARYLRWRYGANPANRYTNLVVKGAWTVRSFCIVKSYGDGLDIVDMQAADEQDAAQLLERAKSLAIERGLVRLQAWVPPYHFLKTVYGDQGFVGDAVVPKFGRRWMGNPEFLRWAPWYLQMGDCDVY